MTDTTDSKQLAERFDLKQLRHELHIAEVNLLPDWPGFEYWKWYAEVVRGAIVIKRSSQPVPRSIPGHIDVEAIKQHADIIVIVENYGISLKKSGNSLRGMCPFHEGKSPGLAVYPDKQTWYCYGCNIGGDVISFVMKMENVGFKEAVLKC